MGKSGDGGKPKRPLNAFLLWLNAHRDELKKKYPGAKAAALAAKAGQEWRSNKGSIDKNHWEALAQKQKDEYFRALANFNNKLGGVGPSSESREGRARKRAASESAEPAKKKKKAAVPMRRRSASSTSASKKKKSAPMRSGKRPARPFSLDKKRKKSAPPMRRYSIDKKKKKAPPMRKRSGASTSASKKKKKPAPMRRK